MLSNSDRQALYDSLQTPDAAREEIERLRLASPMKSVGKSALTNMVTYLWSRMMGKHLVCESRTCEALCFMHLEHQGKALEIYPQVQMLRVERHSVNGHRTTEPITCDALVFMVDRIVFLECKYERELEKLAAENPREWIKTSNGWSRPAAEKWAAQRGCEYQIWSPPEPHGYYWANLEAIFPLIGFQLNASQKQIGERIVRRCAERPMRLSELIAEFLPCSLNIILVALADRHIFGTLKASLLTEPDSVVLSTDRERIDELSASMLCRIAKSLSPIEVDDPLLCATKVDYQNGIRRLHRVEAMIAGHEPTTRRYLSLVRGVKKAIEDGTSPLVVCLTNYCKSGPTNSKLSPLQILALKSVIDEQWQKGKCRRLTDLYTELKKLCAARGIVDVPSKTTLRKVIKSKSRAKHDLNSGGNRAYHANRPPSDPIVRSVKSLLPFQVAHIDATKFDHRSAATTLPTYPFSCPILYSAIDQATGDILGRSLTFGPPSRFGLGLLIRDIVFRHGKFPLAIVADRGSELWSKMMIAFAVQYRITLHMRPAGAGRYGSEIENALREINANVAHPLVGSTLPDQAGRSVDGKFKSYATARLAFHEVVKSLDHFMFSIWPTRPIGELGATPTERRQELEAYGSEGRTIAYDITFELATSVPLDRDWKVDDRHSIRAFYREYVSAEMTILMRENGRPDEVRLDCANPSFLYAKFGNAWTRAHASDTLEMQVKKELDRIFDSVYTRDKARINRDLKQAAKDGMSDRIAHANASAPATADVQPRTAADSAPTTDPATSEASLWDFSSEETPAFEEFGNA